jgi:hypothetical protein
MPRSAGELVVVGVDPDTQGTGFAVVTRSQILSVGIVPTKNGYHGFMAVEDQCKNLRTILADVLTRVPISAVFVETPQDYGLNRRVDPNKLMLLSMVAGAAVALSSTYTEIVKVVWPSQWKGQRKKAQDHRLTMDHYRWAYEDGSTLSPLGLPEGCMAATNIPPQHEKEVLDAAGIAWYGVRWLEARGVLS